MCMIVDDRIKPKKVDSDGYCVGWKVVSRTNNSVFVMGGLYNYCLGENQSSRKSITLVPYTENQGDGVLVVNEGFHLCLSRSGARQILRKKFRKVIKVYYKPEDVVAYGTFCTIPNVVVTKLTVKSFESQ